MTEDGKQNSVTRNQQPAALNPACGVVARSAKLQTLER
jgi:hypothetical protein